jgi:hypothetical protein
LGSGGYPGLGKVTYQSVLTRVVVFIMVVFTINNVKYKIGDRGQVTGKKQGRRGVINR